MPKIEERPNQTSFIVKFFDQSECRIEYFKLAELLGEDGQMHKTFFREEGTKLKKSIKYVTAHP